MKYFGTDLTTAGHYTWDLDAPYMNKIGLLPSDTPFNPEELTRGLSKGETIFYQGGGFTLIGISGSCIDKRPGTKSIFWVDEIVDRTQMVKLIHLNKHAAQIINNFGHTIEWHY